MGEPIADLLQRNPEWVAAARSSLIDVSYSSRAPLDPIAVAQREAFDLARRGRFDAAESNLRRATETVSDKVLKGWLLEQVAAFVHPLDSARSQTILLAANDLNSHVTKPLTGISYTRMNTSGMDQAREASSHLRKYSDANTMVVGVNGLLADLAFQPDTSEEFEEALREVGLHLGLRSQRPEKEKLAKLDVLWGLSDLRYLLLPCKNGAVTATIPKRYTDEIAGALTWFRDHYGNAFRPIAAIVHPSIYLADDATAPPEMRVISQRELGRFKEAVRAFALAVKDRRGDPEHIRRALSSNGLLGPQIPDQFTVSPTRAPGRR